RLLALAQERQEDDASVRKFQRIVMRRKLVFIDLAKDRRCMSNCTILPRPYACWQALNLVSERQLRSRHNAHCDARIFRCRESSCACAKVTRGKLITNFGRPRFDAVKAVVAHLGLSHRKAPQPARSYPLCRSSASASNGPFHEFASFGR